MEISLSIRGQELKLLGQQPNLYHGSVGVLYIKFCDVNFDKSLIKTVRFKTAESEWYTQEIIDGRVRVPHEVIKVGGFDVAVGGYDTENGELVRFLPTNSVHIDVLENGYGEPDAPMETEGEAKSVLAEMYDRIDKKADLEYVESLIPQRTQKGKFVTLTDHIGGCTVGNYRIFGNSVQETKNGKNIFDVCSFAEEINKTITQNGYEIVWEQLDGRECLKVYGLSVREAEYSAEFKDNTRYCISFDYLQVSSKSVDGVEYWGPSFMIVYTDGSSERLIGDAQKFDLWRHLSFVTAKDKTVSHIKGGYGTGSAYTYIADWQIEEGTEETEYEPYWKMPSAEFPSEIKSVGINTEDGRYKIPVTVKSDGKMTDELDIYIDAPLRKVNDICDYIDFSKGCVVRNVYVSDDSGTLDIERSFGILPEPIYEDAELPLLCLPENDVVEISADMPVSADVEITYRQDINKIISELKESLSAQKIGSL